MVGVLTVFSHPPRKTDSPAVAQISPGRLCQIPMQTAALCTLETSAQRMTGRLISIVASGGIQFTRARVRHFRPPLRLQPFPPTPYAK